MTPQCFSSCFAAGASCPNVANRWGGMAECARTLQRSLGLALGVGLGRRTLSRPTASLRSEPGARQLTCRPRRRAAIETPICRGMNSTLKVSEPWTPLVTLRFAGSERNAAEDRRTRVEGVNGPLSRDGVVAVARLGGQRDRSAPHSPSFTARVSHIE